MTYTGHRNQMFQLRDIFTLAGQHIYGLSGTKKHWDFDRSGFTTVHNHGIDGFQARRTLAHWTGWKPPAVAKTPHTVNDHDLFITRQRVMLQTIIGNDDLYIMLRKQCLHGITAHRRYRNRRACTLVNQYRLITGFSGCRSWAQHQWILRRFTTVTA